MADAVNKIKSLLAQGYDAKDLGTMMKYQDEQEAGTAIEDLSGPIQEGVVESGEISREEFDKARNPEKMDKMGAMSKILSGMGKAGSGPMPSPVKMQSIDSKVGMTPELEARKRALMALISGQRS